ncbi:hypothetical protein CHH65_03280 [Shouchella clausii]|nr:hypothetical protein CHH65_03280 [Shouchella clausii]
MIRRERGIFFVYSIGLDIGTTSAKAVLYTANNEEMCACEIAYPLLKRKVNYAEQDPDVVVDACFTVLHHVINKGQIQGKDVSLVALSSAMHSLIAVDQNGKPLTLAITWADNRCAPFMKSLKGTSQGRHFYENTGIPIHPMSWIGKIHWLRENERSVFKQAYKFITMKEYLCLRLTGHYVVDHSMASGTGLYHLRKQAWDKDVLAFLDISEAKLSSLVPTTYELPPLTAEAQALLPVGTGCRFFIGAGDGVLANIGADALEKGTVAITIGTSGAVRTLVDDVVTDELQRTFCYALTEGKFIAGGATNNGGMALQWFIDQFSKGTHTEANGRSIHETIIKSAANVPAGSEGLLFLPFLNGERAPFWDPDARGTFFGVSMHHQHSHFARAVMEGVLYSICSVVNALKQSLGTIDRVQASGGFARSPEWVQMLADIIGQDVSLPPSHHASALGAVLLAKHAIGELDMFAAAKTEKKEQGLLFKPNLQHTEVYQELFAMYERLYQKLETEFSAIAAFQSK